MKTVLVTAGPTYEPIDPVRFIGNRSSGKQGLAIAKIFALNFFKVKLIIGPVNENLLLNLPQNITLFKVNTAIEMYEKCIKNINCDIAIHTAAVADFRVKNISSIKIKKEDGFNIKNIEFIENPDILYSFGNSKNRPKILIGFAAETDNFIENGKKKLVKKKCDFIIVNDVFNGKVFNENTNQVIILGKNNYIEKTEKLDKNIIAKKVFDLVKDKI